MSGTRAIIAREKAEQRVRDLWAYYNDNGVLYLYDFKRIAGGQYQSLLDSFKTHGLEAPPVYDSRQEKYRRKAQRLQDEAARLGQDFLTLPQAAKVLNTKPSRVVGIIGRLTRAGFKPPEVVLREDKYPPIDDGDFSGSGRLHGTCDPLYYPAGLQVLCFWPGPGANQITYHLR